MFRYYLIKPFLMLFGALPLWFHRAAGRLIGFLAHYVVRYRLKVVRKNLAIAFPGRDTKSIERGFYHHFGRLVAENIWLGAAGPKRFRKSGVLSISNPEVLKSTWESSAGGIVLLYSHNCNWELFCGFLSNGDEGMTQDNVVCAYRKIKDPVWERIFNENRTHCLQPGFKGLIETHDIIRHIISHKAERQCLLMITDQRPYYGTRCSMTVNFFGREVHTMDGGAAIACKFGWPVLYVHMRRKAKGYEVTYTPMEGSTPEALMTQYYRLLEEDITQNPSTYLWSHNRWK